MRVGFILLDKKRPRVLTAALSAASEQHGVELVTLDPTSPQQWAQQGVHVIVHKIPEDSDLDARLEAFLATHPLVVLLDPPAAVRALQHREAMLAPLAGQSLLLKQCAKCSPAPGLQDKCQEQLQPHVHPGRDIQQPQQANTCQQYRHWQQHRVCQTFVISTPAQVTLHQGCSYQQAVQQLAHAGIQLPALVKPLTSAPTDAPSAAAAGSHVDGHALGAVFDEHGVQQLLQGAVPNLALPVVVQQFVPHGEALYKLYVIGPHVVLTRRSTLTLQQLDAARAAATRAAAAGAAAGDALAPGPGVVLLQRVSAVPLPNSAKVNTDQARLHQVKTTDDDTANHMLQPVQGSAACAADCTENSTSLKVQLTQQQQQQQQQLEGCNKVVGRAVKCRCCECSCGGVALADASVTGDAAAPPLWAMQQLAAYLRQTLQLNLFNIDIIAPERGPKRMQQQTAIASIALGRGESDATQGDSLHHEAVQGNATGSDSSVSPQHLLVVDVNFFPGYDKVAGAEQLFADYLASLKR